MSNILHILKVIGIGLPAVLVGIFVWGWLTEKLGRLIMSAGWRGTFDIDCFLAGMFAEVVAGITVGIAYSAGLCVMQAMGWGQ